MIYDTNGTVLLATNLRISPDGTKSFQVQVDCFDNYELAATCDNISIGVNGKTSPGDSWTDIVSTPLDLSSFAPERRTVYIEIGVADGASHGYSVVKILVRPIAS